MKKRKRGFGLDAAGKGQEGKKEGDEVGLPLAWLLSLAREEKRGEGGSRCLGLASYLWRMAAAVGVTVGKGGGQVRGRPPRDRAQVGEVLLPGPTAGVGEMLREVGGVGVGGVGE